MWIFIKIVRSGRITLLLEGDKKIAQYILVSCYMKYEDGKMKYEDGTVIK